MLEEDDQLPTHCAAIKQQLRNYMKTFWRSPDRAASLSKTVSSLHPDSRLPVRGATRMDLHLRYEYVSLRGAFSSARCREQCRYIYSKSTHTSKRVVKVCTTPKLFKLPVVLVLINCITQMPYRSNQALKVRLVYRKVSQHSVSRTYYSFYHSFNSKGVIISAIRQ